MRAEIIRIYKSVHTWTGITCGMALFIAFYAGAITMFNEPIARWLAVPSVGANAVSLDDAPVLIAQVLASHPETKEGFRFELRSTENIPARVTWHEHPVGADGQPDHSREEHWGATLDSDGRLRAIQQEPSEVAVIGGFVDRLHRTAGIPGRRLGGTFMGIVSLVYAIALISGVIVLLPSLVKDLFLIRVGRNLKRMWLDAHNAVGVMSLPFHVIMALTGTMYGLGLYLMLAMQPVAPPPPTTAANPMAVFRPAKPSGEDRPMLSPKELLAIGRRVAPNLDPSFLIYRNPGDATATVMLVGQQEKCLTIMGGDTLLLSATTGEVLSEAFVAGRLPAWMAAAQTFDALHFGSYGGWPVRWSYFLLGLAGAWLFYSGNLLWIETRRKRARKAGHVEQSRSTRLMGSATVGVCLGCIAGISLTIVCGKWLHGRVADLNAWHAYIYYAVFLGSVAWAFALGAARSAMHLTWLCTVFTAAIPLTTLAAWTFPSLGMWAHTNAAALGVDAVAFIGALCFAWIARTTARRVKQGPADSIWSIRRPARNSVPDGSPVPAE